MGKLISYISILVAIDLLFLITGQLSLNSPTSIIINAILSPQNIQSSQLWILIIGGISGLALGAAIIVGFVTRSFELFLFIAMVLGLASLIGDFATIYVYLANFNIVLATSVMSPIMILFVITMVEWLKGKD